jgi:hypothetical protein
MIFHDSVDKSFDELIDMLNQLTDDIYSKPCCEISGSSIGSHTRHIIEMFQCLIFNYESGKVNYDERERNLLVESDLKCAIDKIKELKNDFSKPDKKITLNQSVGDKEIQLDSNYYRELFYNFEHAIHHKALIKVALLKYNLSIVNGDFGVAQSTIKHRNQCAQ